MKHYSLSQKSIEQATFLSIECDICHEVYFDQFDIQEFHCIHIRGGYTSVFGDDDIIECDICQDCLKELIGQYIRYPERIIR